MDTLKCPRNYLKDIYKIYIRQSMDNKKDMSGGDLRNSIILHKKNAISVFLNKKTEKIAAAVYLLTTLSADEGGKDSMVRLARKLLSLLQVGHYARLISDMNHSVFKREIDALIGHIEGRFSRAGEVALSSVFFQIDSLSHESDSLDKPEAFSKGHLPIMSFRKKTYIAPISPKKDKVNNTGASNENEKIKRHSEVMNFFRTVKKSDVTIKDISSVMKDCSEKTIQRELIDSVQKGLLRKEGERRWSRYFLVG